MKTTSIILSLAAVAIMSSCSDCGTTTASGDGLPKMPMSDPYENTLEYAWEKKKVLESKLLSDAESSTKWIHEGRFGEMALSSEKAHSGKSSIMITSPTKGPNRPGSGRPWGTSGALFQAEGADWSDWNRISFWIYPDLPGHKVVSINTVFYNENGPEDEERSPNGKHGDNFQILDNHKWSKVNLEIGYIDRKKVRGFAIRYRLQGNEPGASETAKFYIDDLALEKVDEDHYEGWNIQPGEIAYNHAGYSINFPKTAFFPDASLKSFSLIDANTKAVAYEGQIDAQNTAIGAFSVADFTKFNTAGTYILQAGNFKSKPFIIDKFEKVFRSSIIKNINHFYTQRCGIAIEGIHDACHLDWLVSYDSLSINVHGGWHDAGDLSQGFGNTNEATLAMAELAVKYRKSDPELADRILAEAKWGAEWVLKTRFGNGARPGFSTKDMWTDNIIGNNDDHQSRANNNPGQNYAGATTEAAIYTAFKDKDKFFADYALKSAIEDYDFAEEATNRPPSQAQGGRPGGPQGGSRMGAQAAGVALSASLAMYEVTGIQKYKDNAIKYANIVVSCQQQEDLAADVPLKGFFYTNDAKETIVHYDHRGQEHYIVMGLAKIARMFPSEAAEWKKALQLYADFYKKIAVYNAPYYQIPAGIYDLDKAVEAVEQAKARAQAQAAQAAQTPGRPARAGGVNEDPVHQIRNGVKLNDRYYMRRFPVWGEMRGNSGTTLTQAKGLAEVANTLNDKDLLNLVYSQLDWHLGRNPFAQSLIYGEGYRYAEQYTVMSGNLIGGMPVGVQTRLNRDLPYWPAENCHNWKEIWVLPSAVWIALMSNF
jgi:Glycosyl hydrolase family 9./N-terminal ig-like domain of cellulase.